MSSVGEWSEEEIAVLLHAKPDVIKTALDAEQVNLDHLTSAINQKTGEKAGISVEEFHALLTDEMVASQITHAVDTVVIMAIDAIADPIAEKEKKKMIKI